jgi:hypothetical protein
VTPGNPDLTATDPGVHSDLRDYLGRIRRVEALRETRALRVGVHPFAARAQATVPATSVSTNPATMIATRA